RSRGASRAAPLARLELRLPPGVVHPVLDVGDVQSEDEADEDGEDAARRARRLAVDQRAHLPDAAARRGDRPEGRDDEEPAGEEREEGDDGRVAERSARGRRVVPELAIDLV